MSEDYSLPRHPWLDELRDNPRQAVDDLMIGRADKSPYARLSDAEFLFYLFQPREGLETEFDALETALIDWLEARRRENWQIRAKHGFPVYISALLEALNTVQMLKFKRMAYHLAERHNTYLRWLEPLRLGTAGDPALELWRCHALLPDGDRFLSHWMRFCVEAGSTRPATYLTVALRGLREIPAEQADTNLRYAMRGLAQRYLARARSIEAIEAKAEFQHYCSVLSYGYPRGPQAWRALWDEALSGIKADQAGLIRTLLDGNTKPRKPETKKTAAPRLDPNRFPAESQALADELKTGKAVATLWPRIEKLFNETLAYCRHSGDSYDFVRSLCRVGDLALKRSRTPEATAQALLVWLPEALEWERDNPHVWMLWAHCLDKLGAWDHCEWVYWEMRRYFPDHEHNRTELARLLLRQGREDEALGLLREAAERFPDREASHVELARLLMRLGAQHYPEAEKWLREVAERNPNNEPSRVILAHLMMAKGEEYYPEAEKWLREVTERHPDHARSRVILARLLKLRGDKAAANALLAELRAENLQDQFAESGIQSQHSGMDISQFCVAENEAGIVVSLPRLTAAAPDALTQAAARASRAAFRLSLKNTEGRTELEALLEDDPDDQLAAFYLDWAGVLPESYRSPPDAYPLQAVPAYRNPAGEAWDALVRRYPELRRLTWGLHWLACLRDGEEFPEKDWQHLEKFAQQPADNAPRAPGEAIVAQWVRDWGRAGANLPPAAIDARAQELIALNINRNLDPVALTTH